MSPAILQAGLVVAGILGFGVMVWFGVKALARLMSPLDWD